MSNVFIVVGNSETFGVFYTEVEAQEQMRAVYDNGYFGELEVVEDGLREQPTTTEEAFNTSKSAIQKDEGFAWSWHCNIAMSCYDSIRREGVPFYNEKVHDISNEAARQFMKLCFDVDSMYTEPTDNDDETVVREEK